MLLSERVAWKAPPSGIRKVPPADRLGDCSTPQRLDDLHIAAVLRRLRSSFDATTSQPVPGATLGQVKLSKIWERDMQPHGWTRDRFWPVPALCSAKAPARGR